MIGTTEFLLSVLKEKNWSPGDLLVFHHADKLYRIKVYYNSKNGIINCKVAKYCYENIFWNGTYCVFLGIEKYQDYYTILKILYKNRILQLWFDPTQSEDQKYWILDQFKKVN